MRLALTGIALAFGIVCCSASRAETVDQQLVECAYIANNVQLMYTAVRANNLKRAFQLRDETKANIHSQTMRERYVDAVATAERHYTQMDSLELKNLLIRECTH